jgi:hypothetical protein
VLKTACSSFAVAFISVDLNLSDGTLTELLPRLNFLRNEVISSFAWQLHAEECTYLYLARAMRNMELVIP